MSDHFARILAARTALGVSQRKLADEAGVHRNSVLAVDRGSAVSLEIVLACQHALERRGVEFLEISGRLGLILPPTVSYAAQISAARSGLRLEQKSLAQKVRVEPEIIASLERGEAAVSQDIMERCLKFFAKKDVALFDMEGRLVVLFPPASILPRAPGAPHKSAKKEDRIQ